MKEKQIRLWTMQPADIMFKNGIYRCNSQLSIYGKDYEKPYEWMIEQMNKRNIVKPKDCSLPIWAWYRHNWKEKKPDFRRIGLGAPGAKMMCIEIESPENEVLLSDFNAWHYVLNNMWLDGSKSEQEFDKFHEWFDYLPKERQTQMKQLSWENIFDIEPYENEWVTKGKYVQAVFWEIKAAQIRNIWYFTAR